MAGIYSGSTARVPESLTKREREILAYLADGLSNQEIARTLYLAEKTVRWYNTQIYSKLGVSNRQEAIAQAKALSLIDTPQATGNYVLPAQSTPFIGRRSDLSKIAMLLSDPDIHLITILAPGGMGKTRLALEAARMQIGRYVDGVVYVSLVQLSSASDIVTAIAEAIGFSFYGPNPPTQQLIDFLRECSLVLVLDNFEHLLEGAVLVADLIEAAPGVRVLTTSRERLNLRGETVYLLRGLDFSAGNTPEAVLDSDAAKLFIQSARRVRPDFEPHQHDLDRLAFICQQTGGAPLGIELAARWVDVLSLEHIAAELHQGIDILETDLRDVPVRQRSIRATFNLTWERLTDEEQRVFMCLSVFRGGFTVEAARAVADADVRSLHRLANKALLQIAPDGRHTIHELLRQFGAEKLAASGFQAQVRSEHAAFFADFMSDRKRDIRTNRQLEALALIDPDFENVRAAWLDTIHRQEWAQLPKFLHSLWFYHDVRTRGQEAVDLFEQAVNVLRRLPSSDVTELALGRVLAPLGWFYNDIGYPERSVDSCDEAIRILRQHNNLEDLMGALDARQNTAQSMHQPDIGTTASQEGLEIARAIGDTSWEANFLVAAGNLCILNADTASALPFAEGALAIFQALGDRYGLLHAFALLGWCHSTEGNFGTAKAWYQQALIQAEAFKKDFSIGQYNTALGRIALEEGNLAAARLYLRRAVQAFWVVYKKWMSFPLVHVARLFAAQKAADRAVQILAVLQRYPLTFGGADFVARTLRSQLEAEMDPEHFAAAWTRGHSWELSALVAELLAELSSE